MGERVSTDDLAFAADWLAYYDPSPDDEVNGERAVRVVAWLRSEIEKREKNAAIRVHAKRLGVSPATVRSALASHASRVTP